jgi:CPA1 family monovalent cation:H+ antiporter
MRGIVTLAGALALPTVTSAGQPFPGRALILYLAFTTIVITMVGQGLTLPFIVRRLGPGKEDDYVREFALAQLRMASAGRERLRELEAHFTSTTEWETATRLIAMLDERVARAEATLEGAEAADAPVDSAPVDRTLDRAVREAERTALDAMRQQGEIGERAFRQAQHEVDLAESLLGDNATGSAPR